MNIVLTGPMGVGKTTIGTRAARILDMTFVDTDSLIEKTSGCSISELFMNQREEHFRKLETQIIKEISMLDNTIIATGGGAVLRPENMRLLRQNGVIVNLLASCDVLSERLKNTNDRPLLEGMEDLQKYLDERAPYYSNADFRIDTGTGDMESFVGRLCHIANTPFIRICACISGNSPGADIQTAIGKGASMIELRLDLIPGPDIEDLIQASGVPIIVTDRENKENLKKAILAGCDFVDIEIDSPEMDELIQLARQNGCRVIASYHDYDSVPETFPERGDADILKIAVMVNSEDELNKLIELHSQHDDVIIIGMGEIGIPLRVLGPLLGSYLTYCSLGEPVAEGQLDLDTMIAHYREMGLR